MGKLDFDLWLEAEQAINYNEYQKMSNIEKSRLRQDYQDYLEEKENV